MKKTAKFTDAQQKVIDLLCTGAVVSHFKGIGSRFSPSAQIIGLDGKCIKTFSVATFRSLRRLDVFEKVSDDGCFHVTYKLKS